MNPGGRWLCHRSLKISARTQVRASINLRVCSERIEIPQKNQMLTGIISIENYFSLHYLL